MAWISWVIENKEWLFDGCGVALVMVGSSWAWQQWQRRRKRNNLSRERPLDFDEVLDRVDRALPLEQSSTWSTVIGLPVTVRGRLVGVERKADYLHVRMKNGRQNAQVRFCVPRLDHPQLSLARRKSKLVVVGKIKSSDPDIELTDVTTVEVT